MKAAVIESPGKLVVRDVPDPKPGEYDVLCQVTYGATCTGTDLHLIDGVFPWPPTYPAILGHESVGRVIEVGSRVENYRIGDLVTRIGAPRFPEAGLDICWGGFAEYGIARDHWAMQKYGLPAQEWQSYRVNQVVPGGIGDAAATMIITWRETLSYFRRMGVSSSDNLLIVGTGGNAMAYIKHAANLGVRQLVVLGSQSRLEKAARLGAAHCVDYRREDWRQALEELSPGGFDFVIDAVGSKNSSQNALEQVNRNGTLGIYGVDDLGQPLLDPFRARGPFRFHPNEYDEAETHSAVVDFILAGKLDAGEWMDLDNPHPLETISSVYEQLRQKQAVKALIKLH